MIRPDEFSVSIRVFDDWNNSTGRATSEHARRNRPHHSRAHSAAAPGHPADIPRTKQALFHRLRGRAALDGNISIEQWPDASQALRHWQAPLRFQILECMRPQKHQLWKCRLQLLHLLCIHYPGFDKRAVTKTVDKIPQPSRREIPHLGNVATTQLRPELQDQCLTPGFGRRPCGISRHNSALSTGVTSNIDPYLILTSIVRDRYRRGKSAISSKVCVLIPRRLLEIAPHELHPKVQHADRLALQPLQCRVMDFTARAAGGHGAWLFVR